MTSCFLSLATKSSQKGSDLKFTRLKEKLSAIEKGGENENWRVASLEGIIRPLLGRTLSSREITLCLKKKKKKKSQKTGMCTILFNPVALSKAEIVYNFGLLTT